MIFYLVTQRYADTIETYRRTWARAMAGRIGVIPYEKLHQTRALQRGTYIFSDVERLTTTQAELVGQVWTQLAQAGKGIRQLNHPQQSMKRYELLTSLHKRNINHFNVYRAAEVNQVTDYPVFIRLADDHQGSRTPLLNNRDELDQAILGAVMSGLDPRQIIIVEFCDVSGPDKLYRKYSAFRVGDRIIPRHLIFSEAWLQKTPDILDEKKLKEERAYLDQNPHEKKLRKIFDNAKVNYGRIDYGVIENEIQVWEINTNPIVIQPTEKYHPDHLPHQEWFAQQIGPAFEAIDQPSPTDSTVPIRLEVNLEALS